MPEWPKVHWPTDGPDQGVKVIPADLGRELYEALKTCEGAIEAPSDLRAEAALARYEREVGS